MAGEAPEDAHEALIPAGLEQKRAADFPASMAQSVAGR